MRDRQSIKNTTFSIASVFYGVGIHRYASYQKLKPNRITRSNGHNYPRNHRYLFQSTSLIVLDEQTLPLLDVNNMLSDIPQAGEKTLAHIRLKTTASQKLWLNRPFK
jgi:hypothetical protein